MLHKHSIRWILVCVRVMACYANEIHSVHIFNDLCILPPFRTCVTVQLNYLYTHIEIWKKNKKCYGPAVIMYQSIQLKLSLAFAIGIGMHFIVQFWHLNRKKHWLKYFHRFICWTLCSIIILVREKRNAADICVCVCGKVQYSFCGNWAKLNHRRNLIHL